MFKKNSLDVYHEAVAYMEEHLFERLRVSDIAKYCTISQSGLEKNFKKYTDAGVMRFFLDLKLDYAAKMLKNGYTVNYLASTLKFSSSAHFSSSFKKRYGVSPLKYKYPLREMSHGKTSLKKQVNVRDSSSITG